MFALFGVVWDVSLTIKEPFLVGMGFVGQEMKEGLDGSCCLHLLNDMENNERITFEQGALNSEAEILFIYAPWK